MWLNLLSMGIKTGAKLYSDKQKTKEALSEAKTTSRREDETRGHRIPRKSI